MKRKIVYTILLVFLAILTNSKIFAETIGYQDTVYGGYDIALMLTNKEVLRTYDFKNDKEDSIKFGRRKGGKYSSEIRIINTDPDFALCQTDYVTYKAYPKGRSITHAIYIINIENMTVTDSIIGKGHLQNTVFNGRKFYTNKQDTVFAHYLDENFEVSKSQKLDYKSPDYLGQLSIDGFYDIQTSNYKSDIFLTYDDTFLYSRWKFDRDILKASHVNEFGIPKYKFKSGDIGIFTSKEMTRIKRDIELFNTTPRFPEKYLTYDFKDNEVYYKNLINGKPFFVAVSSIKLNKQIEQGITHSIGFYEPEDYAEYQEPLPQEANAFAFDIFTGDTIDLFNRTLPIESIESTVVFRRDEYTEQDYREWLNERKLREIQNKWGIVWY